MYGPMGKQNSLGAGAWLEQAGWPLEVQGLVENTSELLLMTSFLMGPEWLQMHGCLFLEGKKRT